MCCKTSRELQYKSLSWVWEVYRKNPVQMVIAWHHEACRVMPDCNPEGRILLSTPHTHNRIFLLHTFHFCRFFLKNKAVGSIADVRHIVMIIITLTFSDVITFSDVKLNGGVRDVLYNQCTSNT